MNDQQYQEIGKGLNKQIELLDKINNKLSIFMLLVILGIIISLFRSCMMF